MHSGHGNIRWDIFCNVIDNFGDIGVCWRLARQLAAEHEARVCLWVDDLQSFQAMCPKLDTKRATQTVSQVIIRHWTQDFPDIPATDIPDVVIEAFACELPENYLAALAKHPKKPRWINLDYLSAEDWVTGCHQKPSPHPRLPLTRYFFFPGFLPATGGLLRESGLLHQRDRWREENTITRRWQQLGQHLGHLPTQTGERIISLFCYENPRLPELLQCWREGGQPIHCLVPAGRILSQTSQLPGLSSLSPGNSLRQGSLTLTALPFVPQEDYDFLLWHCDLNFVRGEDSLVRAQWAARPLVWHIYPQEERAHLHKLSAFLDLYCRQLEKEAARALRDFWQIWNGADDENMPQMHTAWQAFSRHLPALTQHAGKWCDELSSQADLAAQLVRFCEKPI